MKQLVFVCMAAALSINVALAQDATTDCEAKAVSNEGKPLSEAAKQSFMKKCEAQSKKAS